MKKTLKPYLGEWFRKTAVSMEPTVCIHKMLIYVVLEGPLFIKYRLKKVQGLTHICPCLMYSAYALWLFCRKQHRVGNEVCPIAKVDAARSAACLAMALYGDEAFIVSEVEKAR